MTDHDHAIAAVRLLQPRRTGAKAKLAAYHDDVLRAAIESEHAAPDVRPMFISMLEAELQRRAGEPPKEKTMDTPIHQPAIVDTGRHQWIPLGHLVASPLNHRKHFDKAKMDELADSVRVQGVVVPVLVRPLPEDNRFEIVAGERRFRAAKMAGIVDLPAIVRELTDAQALELQVVENGQRVDVHPMEEAEGYEALMKCARVDGSPYTVDDIAAKVGKSKAYVYARLKLLDLCAEGRAAFWEGKIPASTALLIARIPVPKLQGRAVKEIVEPKYHDNEPMSFREAKDHIEENYMLRLKEAPFKTGDESLVPKAGSCKACPKRTGNQPELFADISGADVCTDPSCFDAKKKAHAERLREEAIASGRAVISGKEAKKIMPNTWSEPKGYVRMDAACREDPKSRTYRALIGKAAADAVLIEKPGSPGEFIEALPAEAVSAALEKKGYKFTDRFADDGEAAKHRLEQEIDQETRFRTYLAVREQIAKDGVGADDLRALIRQVLDYTEPPCERLVALWGASPDEFDPQDLVKKAPNAQLLPMLVDAIVSDPGYVDRAWEALAKPRGIDAKEIRRQVKAELKSKAKAEETQAEAA